MQPTRWTGNFMADVFTDRLNPTEEFSFNDPVPTKCSFGRGKRQEEIPIPRMPKILPIQLKENNVPGIGRGLQRKANSPHVTKPGTIYSQRKPDQKTDLAVLQDPVNLEVTMQPLFLDQKCQLSIPSPNIRIDYPIPHGKKVIEQVVGLDMKNETEFPSLSVGADKDTTPKQTKMKSQKKKKRSPNECPKS